MHNTTLPPPLARLAVPATAIMFLLLLAGPAQAQNCTRSTCTITLKSVSPVVDGCGEHATPGRMSLTLSSSDSSKTRSNFPTSFQLRAGSEHRANDTFTNFEHRFGGRWRDGGPVISWAGGNLGENIIEVRPKAGARVWSNRNPSKPIQGPGELVVQTFNPPSSGSQYTSNEKNGGAAYFLFIGGKGCARVNEWGETDGTIQ